MAGRRQDKRMEKLRGEFGQLALTKTWNIIANEFQKYINDGCAGHDWPVCSMVGLFLEQNPDLDEQSIALISAAAEMRVYEMGQKGRGALGIKER